MKSGIDLIEEERRRQIEFEGFSYEHDDIHVEEELPQAAACYATPAKDRQCFEGLVCNHPVLWPWRQDDWKPTPENRIKELVKAGALIVAEIDRLQRI